MLHDLFASVGLLARAFAGLVPFGESLLWFIAWAVTMWKKEDASMKTIIEGKVKGK